MISFCALDLLSTFYQYLILIVLYSYIDSCIQFFINILYLFYFYHFRIDRNYKFNHLRGTG